MDERILVSSQVPRTHDDDGDGFEQAAVAPGQSPPPTRHRRDVVATLLGIVVFAVGVAMLVFVFQTALRLFNTPLDSWFRQTTKDAPKLQDLAGVGTLVAIRVVLLAIMAVVGSLVTNRGIQMYFGASARPPKR